ncbi:MAG: hypothetical protein HUU15_05505 [Candidatus Brocadiae bacterium]|nr:hypothetical protein [Candidatus Brocadiia bacterium]
MITGVWLLTREGDQGKPRGAPVSPDQQDRLTLAEGGAMTYFKKARDSENTGRWSVSADGKTLLMGGDTPEEQEECPILELTATILRFRSGPLFLTWERRA